MSEQSVTTEAGNTNSAVIGIIDNEEIIRQKFSFNRKVVLSRFVLSLVHLREMMLGIHSISR